MKVVITGSHFSPAYAVIKRSNWKISVIGRRYALSNNDKESFEYKICKQKGIPFIVLDVPRFLRVSPIKSLLSCVSIVKSIIKAYEILKKVNPDVVLSFGGYTSLPVVIAAWILRKPVAVHEQTLGAGLANRISSLFASRIFISFSSSRKYFSKKKTFLTGNPIREEILSSNKLPALVKTQKPIIYVTGGSTGSLAINDLVKKIISSLSDYYVIHQQGISEENPITDVKDYMAQPFFTPSEVAWIMNNASLIVSRSGINTVSEVLYLNLPAIFIPLPYGQKNEQLKNARYAQKHGRAQYFVQEKIEPKVFVAAIRDMIRRGKSKRKSTAMHKSLTATDLIINETQKLYSKTKKSKGKRN